MSIFRFKPYLFILVLASMLLSACQQPTGLPATVQMTASVTAEGGTPDRAPTGEASTPTGIVLTPTRTPRAVVSRTPTSSPAPAPTSAPAPSQTPEPTVTPEPVAYPMPLLGVETHRLSASLHDPLVASGATLMRRNALMWGLVEPTEGARDWGTMTSLEGDLAAASELGLDVILIVRHTPSWAHKVPNTYCGPMKAEKLDAFAAFMRDAVERYSQPPYNVHLWELGNEPDVDPSLLPADIQFGCWGDVNEEFYGGEYYAEMLKVVYPVIKEVDPSAQVLIGGLLLTCDPTHPPEGNDCKPAKFFEGILVNGGGDYFDLVSFHAYGAFLDEGNYGDADPVWVHRGGSLLGKADYLREVMAAYGVDKPLILTESSLICPEWALGCQPVDDTFYEAQAEYAVSLLARSWSRGFYGVIWYQFEGPGWRSGSLIYGSGTPKPAYDAFQFFQQKLAGGTYAGALSEGPGLYGYEFDLGDRRVWVMWSADGGEYTVALPNGFLAAYDMYGSQLEPGGTEITVRVPIYIEFSE